MPFIPYPNYPADEHTANPLLRLKVKRSHALNYHEDACTRATPIIDNATPPPPHICFSVLSHTFTISTSTSHQSFLLPYLKQTDRQNHVNGRYHRRRVRRETHHERLVLSAGLPTPGLHIHRTSWLLSQWFYVAEDLRLHSRSGCW